VGKLHKKSGSNTGTGRILGAVNRIRYPAENHYPSISSKNLSIIIKGFHPEEDEEQNQAWNGQKEIHWFGERNGVWPAEKRELCISKKFSFRTTTGRKLEGGLWGPSVDVDDFTTTH